MSKDNQIIYRVFDKKNKYHQSYSEKLPEAYKWAVECATLIGGKINKSTINKNGETESNVKVFPKNED